MKNFFKKSLLLFVVAVCFSLAAAANSKVSKTTGPDIYARLEIENYSHLVYGPYYDQWDEGQGDLVVRFYSDPSCTTPYTLTDTLTVHIKWYFEETYNYSLTAWGDIDHWTVTASAGYNYVVVGNAWGLFQHHTVDEFYPHTNLQEIDHDNYFSVESPGDGSYFELPTLTPY